MVGQDKQPIAVMMGDLVAALMHLVLMFMLLALGWLMDLPMPWTFLFYALGFLFVLWAICATAMFMLYKIANYEETH